MKLTVQTLTGKSHTLDVDDTISVATLKTQIQGHIGASASEQALFCNGLVLVVTLRYGIR